MTDASVDYLYEMALQDLEAAQATNNYLNERISQLEAQLSVYVNEKAREREMLQGSEAVHED